VVADGTALIVTADDLGRRPVFRIELATAEGDPAGGGDGHYTDLCVSPEGAAVYALRDAVDAAPAPIRLDTRTPDQAPVFLRGPDTAPAPSGSVTEVTTTTADGTALRSWLVLPEGPAEGTADGTAAGTARHPLLLWVHGGPLGSWSGWSWRWNPVADGRSRLRRAAARPGAVHRLRPGLHPPRLGVLGRRPYTDLMALTDAALEHPRSTRPARRRWAAASAATWPTGSPATPTGSEPW
jgi:hypothetical protein